MEDETNGFKFALTLIATFATISIMAYNYFQNITLEYSLFIEISVIIALLITLSISLIFYVFLKGISMEIQSSNIKKSLENFSSKLYLVSFYISIMTLTMLILFFWFLEKWHIYAIILTSISLIVLLLFSFLKDHKLEIFSHLDRNKILIFSFIFIINFTVFFSIFGFIGNSPLSGQIKIDIDSIYYTEDKIIPVQIQVTGIETALNISLYSKEGNNRYLLTDFLYIDPKNIIDQPNYGDFSVLYGTSLNNGKYNILIETNNLTEGYYELRCSTFKDEVRNSFYLLNNSQM